MCVYIFFSLRVAKIICTNRFFCYFMRNFISSLFFLHFFNRFIDVNSSLNKSKIFYYFLHRKHFTFSKLRSINPHYKSKTEKCIQWMVRKNSLNNIINFFIFFFYLKKPLHKARMCMIFSSCVRCFSSQRLFYMYIKSLQL